MPVKAANYNSLKECALSQGADLFGVADITGEYEKFSDDIRDEAKHLPYAVVIAVKLSVAVLNTVEDHPTNIYKTHYNAANSLLDNIAFKESSEINEATETQWIYRQYKSR